MSRKISLAALAAALVTATCFVSVPAEASNMGFKLERNFEFVSGFKNVYQVAFPLYNGLGDIAGSDDADGDGDPCNNTPDGLVLADDIICHLWTERDTVGYLGDFSIATYNPSAPGDPAGCTLQGYTGLKLGENFFFYVGPFVPSVPAERAAFDFRDGDLGVGSQPGRATQVGYQVIVGQGSPAPFVTNPAVIVGAHNPNITQQMIGLDLDGDGRSCLNELVNVEYHTMYTNALEILCGQRGPGLDWEDADMDGSPDTCTQGAYDCQTQITVAKFFNDPADASANTDDGFTIVNLTPGDCTQDGMFVVGRDFQLVPGESVTLAMNSGQLDRPVLKQHF